MTQLSSLSERGHPTFVARGNSSNIDSVVLKNNTTLSSESPAFIPASVLSGLQNLSSATCPSDNVNRTTSEDLPSTQNRFTIVWDHPPYSMEVSSSEESPSETTQWVSPSPIKIKSTPRYMYDTAVSPSPIRNKSPVKCLVHSPTISEVVDWVDFSSSLDGLDSSLVPDRGSSWGGESWQDEEEPGSPFIITPETSKSHRQEAFTIPNLTSLLHQESPRTPPSSPRIRRASKSPVLSLIESASGDSTPSRKKPLAQIILTPNRNAQGRLLVLDSNIYDINLKETDEDVLNEIEPEGNRDNLQPKESQDKYQNTVTCAACHRMVDSKHAKKMVPCDEIICASCFSSSLSAVSVTQGHSQCPACLRKLSTFERVKEGAQAGSTTSPESTKRHSPYYPIPTGKRLNIRPIIMRIDNVAWDVTPSIVENFLPPETLSKSSPLAVHIPINRFDGRTKDYLYIEVDSVEAGRQILQNKQNTYMSGGPFTSGKKRPVTITPVSQSELIAELRPHSSQELHALLQLCQGALGPQSATTRFIKSRHGPFYALMSTMSKLIGNMSSAYWDVFHVASGAIAVLAQTIYRQIHYPYHPYNVAYNAQTQGQAANKFDPMQNPGSYVLPLIPAEEEDQAVLDKLLVVFEKCFGIAPRTS